MCTSHSYAGLLMCLLVCACWSVQALAAVYPSLVVLMLWGNVNSNAKALFRDQLMVGMV